MTLSIVTHLRQPDALPPKLLWDAHGDEHPSACRPRPILLVACGDLETSVYNGEFEVIRAAMAPSEINGTIQKLMERARYCYELERRHAQEDREPVEPILARAAQLQTINLVVLDRSQGEAEDVLASVQLAVRSRGAVC